MAKVIAEIGINHNGQMDIAKSLIDMANEAGAHAVKFQMRDVETVYAGELDKPRNDGNPYGWKTVGDQKRGIEFSFGQYTEIDAYCKKVGIPWFASCWDLRTFDKATTLFNWPYHKVASAMLTNVPFLTVVADDERFTFISTGGMKPGDIGVAMDVFKDVPTCLMHCVAQYPCPDDQLALSYIKTLRIYKPSCIGYSGHEVGLYPSVMAIAMGAEYVERHITLNRSMYGSDQAASLEYPGLKKLCDIARAANSMINLSQEAREAKVKAEAECMKKLRYWEK
jgi:N-acetylneuraminate synthase